MTLATWIDASQSTSIARFGYEEASNVLWIEYQTGHKYKYLDVPQDVFEQMKSAPSKGQFVNQNIKDKYDYEEVK